MGAALYEFAARRRFSSLAGYYGDYSLAALTETASTPARRNAETASNGVVLVRRGHPRSASGPVTVLGRYFLDGPRLALRPHIGGITFTVPVPRTLSKVHR